MERLYKNSEIPWMKQIPSDWDIIRGKNLLNLMNRPVREDDDVVTCFRDGEVILRSERRTEGFTMSDKEIGYQGINKGDIVIHGMDGFAGSMGVSKSTGKGSPVLIVCNPKSDDDARYIIYYLRSLAMNNVFVALATGIRERSCDLRWNKISVLPFVRPTFGEQKKIADFIDMKSEEIDSLIGLQEQMIEKLKAYKQSVITEAVTKGLNPNAKLVPSCIDWIGELPEGWRITVLRRFANIILGKMLQPNAKFKEDTLEQYICAKDVHFEGIDISDLKKMYFNRLEKEMYQVHKGDMLVVEGGAGAAGSCVLKTDLANTYIQNSIMIVRPKQGIDIRFIQYYEFSLVKKGYVDYVCNKATIPHFTKDKLSSMPIPLPPLSEQQTIASYLDGKCSEIDKLIAAKQQKIEKLRDYKKSVIYEAVTGKTIV